MSAAAARVQLTSVVKGAQLGKGGQGTVWAVEKRLINGEWPVAFKEYDNKSRAELRSGVLERMVAFLPAQSGGTPRWLGEHTAWPAALVTQGNNVHGFLMRQIPDQYFRVLKTAPEKRTAGFEYLLNTDTYIGNVVGISFTPRQRFQLLLDLAEKLSRLHRLGVVVGDLSPKNLLFSLQGSPSCFLIDCDAMVLGGEWALKPVQTPGWRLPGSEQPTTPQGDAYKFALLAARLFIGEQHGSDVGILKSADAAVGRLAQRSLAGLPAQRPALSEWLGPLASAVGTAPATLTRPAQAQSTTTTQTATPTKITYQKPTPKQTPKPTPKPTPTPTVVNRPTPTRTVRTTTPVTPPVTTVKATSSGTPAASRPRSPAPPPRKKNYGCVIFFVLLIVAGLAFRDKVDEAMTAIQEWATSQDSGSSSSAPQTREEQAQKLESLLTDNHGTRGSVSQSVSTVMGCPGGSKLSAAKVVFDDAADNRDRLVGVLEESELDQLPDGLTADLRAGWESSAEADRAYSRLADDMADGCTTSRVTSSQAWADAERANVAATRAKQDFVGAWNPLAEEYGLQTLSWDEV
ncbi:hypothetical protein [Streptomyces sp. NPDC020681]|uniref:hypothetical protein n=1 Tax=Streptomyces sp. NPDC020681 TaxID=3365083 RepID=UPI0037A2AC74